jgi:prepilin-type N-terminal cleavage/methylation domain-containing protein
MRHKNGFTLLELLIVIAIIGIMASVLWINLLRGIRSTELRENANQIVADLRRARSQAQRGSTNIALTLPGTSGGKTYTADGKPRIVPNTMSIICKTNCGASPTVAINYSAPYGEINDAGKVFILRSNYAGLPTMEIRIFGVTGKIILTQVSS